MSRRGGFETAYSFHDTPDAYVPPVRLELTQDIDGKHGGSGSGLPPLSVKSLEDVCSSLKSRLAGVAEKSEDDTSVRRGPQWMKDIGSQLTRGRSLTALLANTKKPLKANGANGKDESSDDDNAPPGDSKQEEPDSVDEVPLNSSTLISNTWKIEKKSGKDYPIFYFNTMYPIAKYRKMIFDDKLFCRARVNLSFEPTTMLQPQVILELEDKQWVIGTCGTFSPEQQKQLEEAQRNFGVGLIIVGLKDGEQLDVSEAAGNVVLDFTGRMAKAQHLDAQNQSMQAFEVWSQIEQSHVPNTPWPSGFYHFYALCVRALNLNSFGKFAMAIQTEQEPNHIAFTYNSLGIMCKRLNRLDIGITLVKSAIFNRPAYFEALVTLGMWMVNENRNLGLNLIARAVKIRPGDAQKLANICSKFGFAQASDFYLEMKKRGKGVKLSQPPEGLTVATEAEMEAAVEFITQQAK